MKKALALLVSVLLIFLPGCLIYVDLDDLLYVTSFLVDLSDSGKPVLYIEAFKPVRSAAKETGEEVRVVYRIEDQTLAMAVNKLQTMTGSTVTFTHCKVILISKKLAEAGLNLYDIFDRRQDFINRTYLCIYDGDPKEYEQTEIKEEKLTGLFLFNLITNCESIAANGVRVDINEFFNQYVVGDHVNSLPLLSPVDKEEMGDSGYNIRGIALLKGSQLIGTLEGDMPKYFNIMLDNVLTGMLAVPNPNEPERLLVLQIVHYKYGEELAFDGSRLSCTKKADITVNLGEVQGSFAADDESLGKAGEELEGMIAENCVKLFEEYKQKQIDIFDIQEAFERKYPQYKDRNIIVDTDLTMDVTVSIQGTSTKWGGRNN